MRSRNFLELYTSPEWVPYFEDEKNLNVCGLYHIRIFPDVRRICKILYERGDAFFLFEYTDRGYLWNTKYSQAGFHKNGVDFNKVVLEGSLDCVYLMYRHPVRCLLEIYSHNLIRKDQENEILKEIFEKYGNIDVIIDEFDEFD